MQIKWTFTAIILILLIAGLCGGGIMNAGTLEAARKISLPEPILDGEISLEMAIAERRSIRHYRDEALTISQISQVLWAAQGITDKIRQFRSAPSAGATYPLEVYLASGRVDGLEQGVFRYLPGDHALLRVMDQDRRNELYTQALRQSAVKNAPAVMVIGGVFERTTGRYGPRGQRYVYMEAGHAGQNIQLQAQALGLGSVVIGAFDDSGVREVLDLSPDVVPLYIVPLGR